jgi:hypothetical protein
MCVLSDIIGIDAAVEVTPLLAPPCGREDVMAAATKGIVRRSIYIFAIFPAVFLLCLGVVPEGK